MSSTGQFWRAGAGSRDLVPSIFYTFIFRFSHGLRSGVFWEIPILYIVARLPVLAGFIVPMQYTSVLFFLLSASFVVSNTTTITVL